MNMILLDNFFQLPSGINRKTILKEIKKSFIYHECQLFVYGDNSPSGHHY
jgi:hypothetical protein